jgi:phosphopentomutase
MIGGSLAKGDKGHNRANSAAPRTRYNDPMNIWLEFQDKTGSEGIGQPHLHEPRWMQYEGPIPTTGDEVIADPGQRFRVVKRVFYFMSNDPTVKVSLHCEELPWKSQKE